MRIGRPALCVQSHSRGYKRCASKKMIEIKLTLLVLASAFYGLWGVQFLLFVLWKHNLKVEFSAKIIARYKYVDDPYAMAVSFDGEREKQTHERYYFTIRLEDAKETFKKRLEQWPLHRITPMDWPYFFETFDLQVDKARFSTELELPQSVRVQMYPARMDMDTHGHWIGFESITIHDKEISNIELLMALSRDSRVHKDKSM